MATTPSPQRTSSTAGRLRVFNALIGVTTLGIFLQAITAGEFVSQEHRGGWITAHNILSDVTITVAVLAAVAGFAAGRAHRTAAWASVVLVALLLLQILLGHLITDAKQDGWIGVHVPLAFLVFGLTIWLAIRGALARRAHAAA